MSLSTNGLDISDFPQKPYEAIHLMFSKKYGTVSEYEHFSGAWNAVAYRYRATIDHGNSFIELLKKDGTSPKPEERYLQEREIFNHFSSCFAVFEAACYGLFSIGAVLQPKVFPLGSPIEQQKVSPSSTKRAFSLAFPKDPFNQAFDGMFADSEFQKWREIRNILTHRTAPGRKIYVSIGDDDAPSTEWKLNNSPLDESIVNSNGREMERVLGNLLQAGEVFCKQNL